MGGFWYGLPKAGRCAPGQVPSPSATQSGCTWVVERRLKTIDQTCLLKDHHYLDKCYADVREGTGFPRSTAALSAAFASDDVAKGGCPDVGGPHVAAAQQ